MKKTKWFADGAAVLVIAVGLFYFFAIRTKSGPTERQEPGGIAVQRGDVVRREKEVKRQEKHRAGKQDGPAVVSKQTATADRPQGRVATEVRKAETAGPSARSAAAEQALEAWEARIDEVLEKADIPAKARQAEVKEAFDKLDKADQLDAIKSSLNVLKDEQFPALYGILYDKSENPEVLDAIFSDALNRPEEVKLPLMKDFVFDKKHPLFFESARILDATGELDKMASKDGQQEDGAAAEEESVTEAAAAE